MVAWDNSSGQYPTWMEASDAWARGLLAAGKSNRINVGLIGGVIYTPPELVGLQSFSLWALPEPSSFAMVGLGVAALMIARRRK